MMIWLKALGIALGFVVGMSGVGLLAAKWDDFPDWLQAVIAIIIAIAVLTVSVWSAMRIAQA